MSFSRVTAPNDYEFQSKEQTGVKVDYIAGLVDRPALTAADLKKMFDNGGRDLFEYLTTLVSQINGLMSALENPTAAANIGAAEAWTGDNTTNIQSKFTALKTYFTNMLIDAGAGDMLKAVYDTNNNGNTDTADNALKLGGTLPSGYAKEVSGQTLKVTLADNDFFLITDSADGNVQKKTLWSTIKSTIQTALVNVFAAKIHGHVFGDLTGVSASGHGHDIGTLSGVAASVHGHTYADLTGVAAASHTHGVTDLSGVVKNTAGIRVSVQSTAPTSPATNDLWVWDAT